MAGNVSAPNVVNVGDLRSLAKNRLPQMVFDYIDSGADREQTLSQNCSAFNCFFSVIVKYLSKFLYWFDQNVVDGVVQMVDLFSKKIAYQFGRLQTGQLQNYALAITIGVVLIFIFYGVNNKIWNLVNLSI